MAFCVAVKILIVATLLGVGPRVECLNFNFTEFDDSTRDQLILSGDSNMFSGAIQITPDVNGEPITTNRDGYCTESHTGSGAKATTHLLIPPLCSIFKPRHVQEEKSLQWFEYRVHVQYDGELKNLTLFLEDMKIPVFSEIIDLSAYLPENVYLGFSGSTSDFTQLNCLRSWAFNGTDEDDDNFWIWIVVPILGVALLVGVAFAVYWKRKLDREKLEDAYPSIEEAIQGSSTAPRNQSQQDDYNSNIVHWVWDLYSKGRILSAADSRLNGDFATEDMECALILGLACCHPNPHKRPSMKIVLQVLKGEAAPPPVPNERPVFMWPALPPSFKELDISHGQITPFTELSGR
ncbi:hypothetical protein GH714_036687 [Hevea brasiliensis]|uniref:Legume lectin domain-containing protein n=1 Tax=Hevea brasiliensis TaxID=3981 RepID=A0A6A6KKK8_HEVBR|nr:hypothetical protein GH714_036687 [Hevea brasiliensis]